MNRSGAATNLESPWRHGGSRRAPFAFALLAALGVRAHGGWLQQLPAAMDLGGSGKGTAAEELGQVTEKTQIENEWDERGWGCCACRWATGLWRVSIKNSKMNFE